MHMIINIIQHLLNPSTYNKSLRVCVLLLCLCAPLTVPLAQNDAPEYVRIGDIQCVGNNRTKRFVINRELDIRVGDLIERTQLQHVLLRNENQLLNTGLFVSASVEVVDYSLSDNIVNILVTVSETWYFLPLPSLKLADRNLALWWDDYDHDFRRLIFGVKAYHHNLTGVRDFLKVSGEVGFSQGFDILYRYPYLNKSRTLGLELRTDYTRAKRGVYTTSEDLLVFLSEAESYNFKSWGVGVNLIYRQAINTSHELSLGFNSGWISDSIRMFNPEYFADGALLQRYFNMSYLFTLEKRDRVKQASRGYFLEALIRQVGFGLYDDLNYGYIQLKARKYWPLLKNMTARLAMTGRWMYNTQTISYNQSQALGYGQIYVRGYERNVIDGSHFILSHQGINWAFFNKTYDLSGLISIPKLKVVPIRLFLSVNLDIGYVDAPEYTNDNRYHSTWIYGYGPAVELLLAETYLFSFEYTTNHVGRSGFYIHSKFNF